MIHGDLAETRLSATLQALAQEWVTGCLHVVNPGGEEAQVYLRNGAVYFIAMPQPGRLLGNRLVSSGALVPEALAEALEAQDGALQAWRLGELLVRLGYVDQSVVDAFVIEQLLEDAAALLALTAGEWEFDEGDITREGIAGGLPAPELLRQVIERQRAWDRLVKLVPGAWSIPRLSAGGIVADTALDLSSDAWAVLSHVDGRRTVADLAEQCGFTMFEATYVIAKLVHGGSLEVSDEPLPEAPAFVAAPVPAPVLAPVPAVEPEPPRAADAARNGHAAGYPEADVRQAAALLSELSRDYGAPPAEAPAAAVAEPQEEPEPEAPAVHHQNDTASLMRELSFLGLDDPPPPSEPASAPPAARRYAPVAAQKKRKGLFGR